MLIAVVLAVAGVLVSVSQIAPAGAATATAASGGGPKPTIVLEHGAWADGSSWSAVTERLQGEGYNVTAPQFPMNALANNVDRLRLVLGRQNGPTIVAGHSYGGQIMTALGTDAPNVVGLVYIAAFGLDEGESIGALLQQGPPTPALAHLDIDSEGFAWLPEDDFVGHFARTLPAARGLVRWCRTGKANESNTKNSESHVKTLRAPDDRDQLLRLIATSRSD